MTEQSSAYFRQVAGEWDDLRAGFFTEAVREAAIAKAYLRPEMVVADVGAGTGFLSAGLAPLVRRVYLVDASPEMLAVARDNLSAWNNIEFHQADGLELPFPDESLDAVFANMYLHHCPDPLAAIREMVRVLRPGGRLVITDMDEHPYAWLKEEMADVWQGFDRDQIRSWFQEAGLVNVIVDCTGQSCCAESSNPDLSKGQELHSAKDVGSAKEVRKAKVSVFVASGTSRMVMRDAVQENYAAVARSRSCGCSAPANDSTENCCEANSGTGPGSEESCCADTDAEDASFSTGYSPVELSAAPKEAAEISLGCGNPIALAGLQEGEVVLDIGSGGGLDAFLAAGKVGPTGRVIGVDMTPAMLERARASAQTNNISNVEFRQGFAEELPVADGEVNVIISNCVINLTEDKGRVFREAFRVLTPGGRLEVSDIVTAGPIPMELRGSAEGWAECVTGALPEQEYLDLIAQAGFQNVATRRSTRAGDVAGVSLHSIIASAIKPDPNAPMSEDRAASSDCDCGASEARGSCCG